MWKIVHFHRCSLQFTVEFFLIEAVQGVGLLEAVGRRETACEDEEEKDPQERPPHCESVNLRYGARVRGEG